MARVYKCDRCGAYYDTGSRHYNSFGTMSYKKVFDLCPTCAKGIEWFMSLEKSEEAEEKKG